MLKNGDKCHVRLKSGEIVEAVYDHKGFYSPKLHWVIIGDHDFLASRKIYSNGECRFVCMTGIRGSNENQKNQ